MEGCFHLSAADRLSELCYSHSHIVTERATVLARLRSIRCRLLCCGGRRGAAATDGAARGCGAVPIPHTGEENTPKPGKPRGGVPK